MQKNRKIIIIMILIFMASLPLLYRNYFEEIQTPQETEQELEEQTIQEMDINKIATDQILPQNESLSDWEDTIQKVSPSIVKIHCGDYMGSGLILEMTEEEIIIATSRHLAMYDVVCMVDFYQGFSVEGHLMGTSQQQDIAFVNILTSSLTKEQLETLYSVDTSQEYEAIAAVGVPIIQVGSSDGPAMNIYVGTVTATNQFEIAFYTEMLVTDCKAQTGMSGGGVFDTEGRLLGMITGGDLTEETRDEEAEVTYSIPISALLEEYEAIS